MNGPVLSAKEFKESGLLQEVNRRLLHQVGLHMFVDVDPDSGEIAYGGVFDFRNAPEGVRYGHEEGSVGHRDMCRRAMKVDALLEQHRAARETEYGYMVQPAIEDLT